MAVSSCEDMSPFPLSIELLEANGWHKSNRVKILFRDFKPIIIGLEPSKLDETKFYPILLPCWMRRTREAMSMYEIKYVHELQALLDMWKINVKIKP